MSQDRPPYQGLVRDKHDSGAVLTHLRNHSRSILPCLRPTLHRRPYPFPRPGRPPFVRTVITVAVVLWPEPSRS